MATHIGKKIEERAAALGLGATELSKKLNTTRKNIYNIFSREIIDSSLLLLCCKVLDHDFFQYFYDEEPLLSFKQDEIQRWQSRLDRINEEKEGLKYLTEVQKELIETQRDDIKNLKALLKEREQEILTLKKSH